jgi:hypothetical protein
MTHLTADTLATAASVASASPFATVWHGSNHLRETIAAQRVPNRAKSIFLSPVANCLEMRRIAFHYSVIGRHATDSPAFGYVARLPLNDEVSASHSEVADPGAHAQGGDD